MTPKIDTIYVVYRDYKGNFRYLKAFWNRLDAELYKQREEDDDRGFTRFGIIEVGIDANKEPIFFNRSV